MTVRRRLLITEGAYAVLTELKRGGAHWHVRRPQPGKVELEVDSASYDALLARMKEWNLATFSDVIVESYKRAEPGALGGEPVT